MKSALDNDESSCIVSSGLDALPHFQTAAAPLGHSVFQPNRAKAMLPKRQHRFDGKHAVGSAAVRHNVAFARKPGEPPLQFRQGY